MVIVIIIIETNSPKKGKEKTEKLTKAKTKKKTMKAVEIL